MITDERGVTNWKLILLTWGARVYLGANSDAQRYSNIEKLLEMYLSIENYNNTTQMRETF